MPNRWPDRLPLPTIEGYGISPGEAILRTEMEAGPARQRRRFTDVPSRIAARWVLWPDQFALFEAWYRWVAARADADSRVLHDIVHSDANTSVDTEGGPVKSVAKAIGDVETAVAAAATAVTEGLAATENARDAALAARDAAQAAVGGVLVSASDTTADKLSVKLRPGYGLQTAIEDAGGEEGLRFAVTPQLNAGALIALAEAFI